MAAMVDIHPVCTNPNCTGNIESEAGSKIVNCLSCKKRMLLKNCPKLFQCVIDISKDGKTQSITAPESILASYFNEDLSSEYEAKPQAL